MKKLLLSIAVFTPLMLVSADPSAPKKKPANPVDRVKRTERRAQPANIDRSAGKHLNKDRQRVAPPASSKQRHSQSAPQATKRPTANT
jgi:hypothetical protein